MNISDSSYHFEMLVLDPTRKTRHQDLLSCLYALRSCSELWISPEKLDEDQNVIRDRGFSLQISDKTVKLEEDQSKVRYLAFSITLRGGFAEIEPRRLKLVEFIKDQKFENSYITRDDVSEHIACELYPYLYRLENRLRGYLTSFLTTRFGGEWWENTASTEMDTKAKQRKKNETVFGRHIENSSFLIDFGELGKLVYEQASGYLTHQQVVNYVVNLPENIESLKRLKAEIQPNYKKFFKEAFADKDFKGKWKEWESLRNKIAHTNLFTNNDLIKGKKIADELLRIIEEAAQSPGQNEVSQADVEAIQEQLIAQSSDSMPLSEEDDIEDESLSSTDEKLTEDDFLKELEIQESFYLSSPKGFVGLARFLRFHLPECGYNEQESRDMLEKLKKEGKVEIYSVDNPYSDTKTAALKRIVS